ncbi:hypothetical protein DFH08DRAFT_818750 [Mycena albidolilacea]|uniref:Uncharacterized protein n=1 Tax=Mycena albidolilacea TaxID=1033008 RepID=A0AAD6ZFY8_9AGAR|nr:hypothetical protein DFH08DRAFT_818750 [Mycena albidolilacea]
MSAQITRNCHITGITTLRCLTECATALDPRSTVTYHYGEYSASMDIVPELDSEDKAEPPALPYRHMAHASLRALPLDDTEVEHDTVINSICAGEECTSTDLRPLPLNHWQSFLLWDPLPCGGDRHRRDLDDYDSHEEEAAKYAKRSHVLEDQQWGPLRFIRSLLPPNVAVAADALCAVAVCMESKHADLMLEGISINLTELLDLARASKAAAANAETRDLSTAEKLHDRASDSDAGAAQASPLGVGSNAPGPPEVSLRSYAVAAATVAHPPSRTAALAKAVARMHQVMIERAPGMETWMEGMTDTALLEKARQAMLLMVGATGVPPGARFIGAQRQCRGAVLLQMNDPAGIAWLKAHMEDFLNTMGVRPSDL